jgi:meso-butanediol dehydrogenase/(S,S)-butanediol dehydrogenase/diacetyl reductase
MLLDGKVSVVTGAGSGMGQAVTELFIAQGAQVVALDLNLDGAEASVAGSQGPLSESSFAMQLDVSDAAAVQDTFTQIKQRTTGADVVVNCAGIREIVSPLELGVDEWDHIIGVNLRGSFFCSQGAARQMVENGRGGSIINVSSVAGIMGYDNRPAYSAAKAGIIGLTKSLARDLGPHGIRANCVAPGLTRTPFTEFYFESEELVRNLPRVIPLGKAATPDQIASVMLFLASDMASYVSGTMLPVDGGHTSVATLNLTGAEDSPFSSNRSTLA